MKQALVSDCSDIDGFARQLEIDREVAGRWKELEKKVGEQDKKARPVSPVSINIPAVDLFLSQLPTLLTAIQDLHLAVRRLTEKTDVAESELLTAKEASAFLKVHLRTIYTYVREGQLRSINLGRTHRFSRSDLMGFIRKQKAA